MSYRDQQRRAWDSLATAHGDAQPLKAVIGSSDLGNVYADRITKRLLAKVLRPAHDDVVLDYGCGVGRLSFWLAHRAKSVIGVDIAPKMIEVAREKADREAVRNISLAVVDERGLPLEAQSIDAIVCCGVLKYILDDDDLDHLIGELGRVLKPEGRVAVIEEMDERGPVLCGSEYTGEPSLLRSVVSYEATFREHRMALQQRLPLYRKRILRLFSPLEEKLTGRAAFPWVGEILVEAELLLEGLLRPYVKAPRGFQLLYFMKSDSVDPSVSGSYDKPLRG